LEYNNPDFVKYAESYGAHGHSITSVTGFIETVDRAYRQGGVHLIDLPVDYSQNVKELITDLRDHQSVV
jgi:acetolactate synthase-1/2/3 large subunit